MSCNKVRKLEARVQQLELLVEEPGCECPCYECACPEDTRKQVTDEVVAELKEAMLKGDYWATHRILRTYKVTFVEMDVLQRLVKYCRINVVQALIKFGVMRPVEWRAHEYYGKKHFQLKRLLQRQGMISRERCGHCYKCKVGERCRYQ